MIAISMSNHKEIKRNEFYENKILKEIAHGLNQDLLDMTHNYEGHETGLISCKYWRKVIYQEPFETDSTAYYYQFLMRDFISIKNTAGYEALKSKGLELVKDDSLRTEITILYEQDYNSLVNLEEHYYETQFQENYFMAFNTIVSPYLFFDDSGAITGLEKPLDLSNKDQKELLSYIWKIEKNRRFVMLMYQETINRVNAVLERIDRQVAHYEK